MSKKIKRTSASVRTVTSGTDSLVETQRGDIFIQPRQIFIDTLAGSVVYEPLFGDKSNVNFLVRRFKADEDLQSRLAAFYRSQKIGAVISDLIQASYVKPQEVNFSSIQLVNSLNRVGGLSMDDSILVADQMIPLMRTAGFNVSVPDRYVSRAAYGRSLVAAEHLKSDVAAQHCAHIMDRVKLSAVAQTRYSKEVLAEAVALDLRHAGARMLSQASYGKVVDGAIMAVRAHLDIENEPYRTSIPEWLRDHSVIAELATNLTFITAAFSSDMPINPVLAVDSEDMKKYLDVLSASLKASTRYRVVTLKSLTEEYSLHHGFDYNEELAFAYITHNVEYSGNILAAMPTFDGEDLTYLDRTDNRVAELLMAHDQGIFNLTATSQAVRSAIEAQVSDSDLWNEMSEPFLGVLDTEQEFLKPEVIMALAFADRVALRRTTDESGKDNFLVDARAPAGEGAMLPDFVYYMTSDGKRLPSKIRNRMLDRNFIITQDAATVVMLAKPFEARRARAATTQLPDDSVFGARLLGVPSTVVQKLNGATDYKLSVGGQILQGKFYLKSVDSMRTSASQVVLVNPTNQEVTSAITVALSMYLTDSTQLGGNARRAFAYNHGLYMYVIRMAQRLSKSFREDVHQRIIAQALKDAKPEESAALRSTFNRSVFAAQVDQFALQLYLEAMGCTASASLIAVLNEDSDMQMALMQEGSDRRK